MSVGKSYLVAVLCFGLVTHVFSAGLLKYHSEISPDGYYFGYKTIDGAERYEEGKLQNEPAGSALSVAGSYEYESNGDILVVTYLADRNGFRPLSQFKKKVDNEPPQFTLDNRIDPKLLGSLAGGGLG